MSRPSRYYVLLSAAQEQPRDMMQPNNDPQVAILWRARRTEADRCARELADALSDIVRPAAALLVLVCPGGKEWMALPVLTVPVEGQVTK